MKIRTSQINWQKELERAKFNSRNSYDLAIGCLNRICVTDSENEIIKMVYALVHHIDIISSENKKRIYIKDKLGGKQ